MYRPTAVSPMIATWQRLEASSLHLQVRCSSNESDDKSATFKHTKSELDSNGGSEPIVDMARPRLVYGSPVGEVVHKLRALSLVSSLFGVVGLPTVLAIKGTMPSTGMLIMSFMFVASTVGSTAFIHAVFSPYIYRIECIPVRVCYSTKETDCSKDEPSTKTDPSPSKKEDTLLKAVKRSLFLRDVEVIFDPEQDIQPYSGFLPLCNFTAKGVPLYVHQGISFQPLR
jgi:hypothetical protein